MNIRTRFVLCAALGSAAVIGSTGCTTTSTTAMASAQAVPAPPEVDARFIPKKGYVTGHSDITAFEFLFFKFGTGDVKFGQVTNPLIPPARYPILEALKPFASPVDRRSALNEAYYDAIENSTSDALIETRAKVEGYGFSLFGLIGYGHAAATVTGKGLDIKEGKPRFATPIVAVR